MAKLDPKNLPPGRFLYTVGTASGGAILEGRVIEKFEDPEKDGLWFKLNHGGHWVWSNDIWIEAMLPEEAQTVVLSAATTSAEPTPPAAGEREKGTKGEREISPLPPVPSAPLPPPETSKRRRFGQRN